MENSILKASIGIDFSSVGIQLHVTYEKSEGRYAVLSIPSEQTPGSGIPVKDLTDDIKKTARGATDGDITMDMTQLKKAITEAAKEGSSTFMRLENIVIRLQMAYLYIYEKEENSVLEYAFQLQVVTEGLVPEITKSIVDVTSLSISIWNTDRKKVVDKMALITVDEYLGAAALPGKSQATG